MDFWREIFFLYDHFVLRSGINDGAAIAFMPQKPSLQIILVGFNSKYHYRQT